MEKKVGDLARSVAEIEAALRHAEAEIEAEARLRIRTIRREAQQQLAVLRGHHREAGRFLSQLVTSTETGRRKES